MIQTILTPFALDSSLASFAQNDENGHESIILRFRKKQSIQKARI